TGWATGASIHAATQYPTITTFGDSNLLTVARMVRQQYPQDQITICADDDWKTEGNPGLTAAREAARVVDGRVATPQFLPPRDKDQKDFNDMLRARDGSAVKRTIDSAVAEAFRQQGESPPSSESTIDFIEAQLDVMAELEPGVEYDLKRKELAKDT